LSDGPIAGAPRDLPAPTYCPYCWYLCDRFTGAFNEDENARPDPGSVNFCLRCGEMSLFDGQLMLRRPTMGEFMQLSDSLGARISAFRRAREEMLSELGPFGPTPDRN
jgi:hypothetical protein